MKLKEGFITHKTGDEQILIDTGANNFAGIVKSNPTAAFIIDCLKENTTEEKILQKMLEKYNGDKNIMAADIANAIKKLKSIGAIDA